MRYSLMNLLRNPYPQRTANQSLMPSTGIVNARSRGSGMLPNLGSMPQFSWPGLARNPFLSYPSSSGLPVPRSPAAPNNYGVSPQFRNSNLDALFGWPVQNTDQARAKQRSPNPNLIPAGPFAPRPIPGFTGTPGPYAGGTGAVAPYSSPYQGIAPASQPTEPVPYYYNKGGY